jgi:hypothetical protein
VAKRLLFASVIPVSGEEAGAGRGLEGEREGGVEGGDGGGAEVGGGRGKDPSGHVDCVRAENDSRDLGTDNGEGEEVEVQLIAGRTLIGCLGPERATEVFSSLRRARMVRAVGRVQLNPRPNTVDVVCRSLDVLEDSEAGSSTLPALKLVASSRGGLSKGGHSEDLHRGKKKAKERKVLGPWHTR